MIKQTRQQPKIEPRTQHTFALPTAAFLFSIIIVLTLITAFGTAARGAESNVIAYQGTLTAPGGSPPPNNQYAMRFTLFATDSGGAELWQEAHETAQAVQVTSGIFAVQLGSITPFPANLFNTHPLLFLEVEADLDGDGYSTSEKFLPRTQLTATPYAFRANSAAQADNALLLEGHGASDFALAGGASTSRQFDAIVAPSGGDYTTIAAALNAARTSIFVRGMTASP